MLPKPSRIMTETTKNTAETFFSIWCRSSFGLKVNLKPADVNIDSWKRVLFDYITVDFLKTRRSLDSLLLNTKHYFG